MRSSYGTSTDIVDIEANRLKSVQNGEIDDVNKNSILRPNVWKFVIASLLLLTSIMAVDISSKGNALYAKLDMKTISMEETPMIVDEVTVDQSKVVTTTEGSTTTDASVPVEGEDTATTTTSVAQPDNGEEGAPIVKDGEETAVPVNDASTESTTEGSKSISNEETGEKRIPTSYESIQESVVHATKTWSTTSDTTLAPCL